MLAKESKDNLLDALDGVMEAIRDLEVNARRLKLPETSLYSCPESILSRIYLEAESAQLDINSMDIID